MECRKVVMRESERVRDPEHLGGLAGAGDCSRGSGVSFEVQGGGSPGGNCQKQM